MFGVHNVLDLKACILGQKKTPLLISRQQLCANEKGKEVIIRNIKRNPYDY